MFLFLVIGYISMIFCIYDHICKNSYHCLVLKAVSWIWILLSSFRECWLLYWLSLYLLLVLLDCFKACFKFLLPEVISKVWLSEVSVEYSVCLTRPVFSELSEFVFSQLHAIFILSVNPQLPRCCSLSHFLESHPVNMAVFGQKLQGTMMQISEAFFLGSSTLFSSLLGKLWLPQQTLALFSCSSAQWSAMLSWGPTTLCLVWKVSLGRMPGWLQSSFHSFSLSSGIRVLYSLSHIWKTIVSFILSSLNIIYGRRTNLIPVTASWLDVRVLSV